MPRRWSRLSVSVGLVAAALALGAFTVAARADDAHAWLMKIDAAAREQNYDGVFVYQHGDKMETMRIIHRVENGRVRERLVSLNGAPREVIRTDREVQCFLPDEKSVLVEHRKAENRGFPSILPTELRALDANYTIALGRRGRIVDRDAQMVSIRPKDGFRYGYELWADRATGLLLRADLVDGTGKAIEQFLFTQITPNAVIAPADLKPQFMHKDAVWHRATALDDAASGPGSWAPTELPPGFKLSTRIVRKMPAGQQPVEHLVYSDGLATVSVFVEKLNRSGRGRVDGPNRMGAVSAYVKVADEHRVTVVGEVPGATVDAIGKSVKPISSGK